MLFSGKTIRAVANPNTDGKWRCDKGYFFEGGCPEWV